jgi:perosamine synthetase
VRSSALVIEGGEPAVRANLHRPWRLTQLERRAALQALDAGPDDAGGPHSKFARRFEEEFADYCDVRHCRSVASGTDALWAMQVAAGIGPGDRVIVPALTWVGTAVAVALVGADIDWCDIDPVTFNLDADHVARLLRPETKSIVAVHAHGLMADMGALRALAQPRGIALLEDAAQAAGATQDGHMAGTLGLLGAGSLNVQKPLQAGDGGWVLTNDEDALRAVVSFSEFGFDPGRPGPGEASAYWSRWLGRTSRLHPLAAAIGSAGLRRLPELLDVAQANAAVLSEGLADLPGILAPRIPSGNRSTYHMHRIRLDPVALGWHGSLRELRDRVLWALRMEGVHVRTWHLEPLPRMPAFRRGRVLPWAPGVQDGPLAPWNGEPYRATATLLDSSFVLFRMPYPIHLQTPRLMRAYVRAFEKVIDRRAAVFTGAYEPLRIVPAIPDTDL